MIDALERAEVQEQQSHDIPQILWRRRWRIANDRFKILRDNVAYSPLTYFPLILRAIESVAQPTRIFHIPTMIGTYVLCIEPGDCSRLSTTCVQRQVPSIGKLRDFHTPLLGCEVALGSRAITCNLGATAVRAACDISPVSEEAVLGGRAHSGCHKR